MVYVNTMRYDLSSCSFVFSKVKTETCMVYWNSFVVAKLANSHKRIICTYDIFFFSLM